LLPCVSLKINPARSAALNLLLLAAGFIAQVPVERRQRKLAAIGREALKVEENQNIIEKIRELRGADT